MKQNNTGDFMHPVYQEGHGLWGKNYTLYDIFYIVNTIKDCMQINN